MMELLRLNRTHFNDKFWVNNLKHNFRINDKWFF